MKNLRFAALGLGLIVMSAVVAEAVYNPTQLPDPSRRWSVSVAAREGYDDNSNTSSDNKQGSATTLIEPQLLVNFPQDQTFLGLRYAYDMVYYSRRVGDDIDQSHSVDLLLSHRFNPRLVLDINETMRRGVEPELVDNAVIQRQKGDYWYNSLSAGLTYNISRRWLAKLTQGWGMWAYDNAGVASYSDRNDLQTSAAAIYSLNPSTALGLNYQFGTTMYKDSGPGDVRNFESHSVFLSLSHQFNPKLAVQVAGGGTIGVFSDREDASPYASVGVSYSYAPGSSVSANLGYALTSSDVGLYRSSDTLGLNAQINHRITRKFRASLSSALVLYSYNNLDPAVSSIYPADVNEEAWRLGAGLTYEFTRWFSADVNYAYERVSSDLVGRDYDRNRVNAGIRLTY